MMKKLLAILLAAFMLLSMVACDLGNTEDPNKDNPGTSQSDNKGGSERVPSTDYFYDHYDFCEEWMMPDDGVYTGYEYISPDSNAAGNEQVNVRIYDITEEQIAAYIQKIEEHGYAHLIGDSYSKKTDFGTSMIKISKYLDDGYIIVYIDPSI